MAHRRVSWFVRPPYTQSLVHSQPQHRDLHITQREHHVNSWFISYIHQNTLDSILPWGLPGLLLPHTLASGKTPRSSQYLLVGTCRLLHIYCWQCQWLVPEGRCILVRTGWCRYQFRKYDKHFTSIHVYYIHEWVHDGELLNKFVINFYSRDTYRHHCQ